MCSTRTATASRWHWPGSFPVEPALPPLRGRVFSAAVGYQCLSAGVPGYDPARSPGASSTGATYGYPCGHQKLAFGLFGRMPDAPLYATPLAD